MLHTWKNSYFAVRAKIESSGRDVRWEFDRKRLFDRSDYIAEVCQDVCDIAQVREIDRLVGVEVDRFHCRHIST